MSNLVTIIGAGPGISNGVAKKFGKEGYKIALIARNEEKLQQQVLSLKEEGVTATYAVGDAGNKESLQMAMKSILEQEGHADMILYNAGIVEIKDMLELDWEAFIRVFNVNVGGAFSLLKAVLPFCLKENKGKLFFTGGGLALEGDPQWATLSISKAALRNLVQAAVKKVKDTNVHVAQVTVCGFVNPEDTKYSPDAIAEQFWNLYNQKPGSFESEIIY